MDASDQYRDLFHHQEVFDEYSRWYAKLPQHPAPQGLKYGDVLRVHFVLVDMFYGKAAGIGGIGPKSLDLLISAVNRQSVSFGGKDKWSRPEEFAATLLYGIVLNHPFHDANKRTAFLSTLLLLNRFGLTLRVTEKQFEDFTVLVAERSFRKMEKYRRDFEGQEDGDVNYVAHYIRGATRRSDKRDYIVTYRELNQILKRFGYEFSDQRHNAVDVIEISTGERVCNVGCHSMTKQVAKGVIKNIRQVTGLDVLNGCDSAAFFKGEEPLNNLLARYYEPLERLAFR